VHAWASLNLYGHLVPNIVRFVKGAVDRCAGVINTVKIGMNRPSPKTTPLAACELDIVSALVLVPATHARGAMEVTVSR
jgi:hypothetical protein